MGCHGGFSLDEAVRREWYNPEAVLQDLSPGMVFVDVGSGDGFFSILAAKIVGAKGKVYAVDVDASAVQKLKQTAEFEGLSNITVKAAVAEQTVFCHGCADMVFYSIVLHDFNSPRKVLVNAMQMIKPDGLLVDLDWKKIDMPFGPPKEIRFSEEQALTLIEQSGFKKVGIKSAGLYHYIITAKPSKL